MMDALSTDEVIKVPILYSVKGNLPDLFSACQIPGIKDIYLYRLGMKNEFRGIRERNGIILDTETGLKEFSPFSGYSTAESARWLKAACNEVPRTPLRDRVEVNVTIPQVDTSKVATLIKASGGCRVAKVKVGYASAWEWENKPSNSQKLQEVITADLDRLQAVRKALGEEGKIRIDVNGAWTLKQALTLIPLYDQAASGLEYIEQPCKTAEELQICRAETGVKIAADELIRRCENPLKLIPENTADILVLKLQPLGGYQTLAAISKQAQQRHLKVVLSSALESNIGIAQAVNAAANLENPPLACGLATGQMFYGNITTENLVVKNGSLAAGKSFTLALETEENFFKLREKQQKDTVALAHFWVRRLRDCWEYISTRESVFNLSG